MGVPKGKLGRIIWRKIGGRVIPIKISNISDKMSNASSINGKIKYRSIVAKLQNGEQVGKLNLSIPKKGVSASLLSVNVEKKFQKKGISKNLFHRATEFLSRAGKKFLNSNDIQHAAQIKIRSNYGLGNSIKAGGKYKKRSRFIRDQVGAFGEKSKQIRASEAIDILKNNRSGINIQGTTMLKNLKKLRKK